MLASATLAIFGPGNGLYHVYGPFGVKPLLEQMISHYQLTASSKNKVYWNLNKNIIIFVQQNAFENIVCKMNAILFNALW